MNVTVTQEKLARALTNIGRVAASRNELPILNNILLRTDGGRLLVAATNLEIAATQYIGAHVARPGAITVPARLITEFVSSLPTGQIHLEAKQEHLHIAADKFSSVINGVVADEFPELPVVDEQAAAALEIPADELKKAVSQVIIAASSDTTRPVLTGVYWHTLEGQLYLAATDGYRLAEKRLMKVEGDIAAIIPTSTLQEVLRSLEGGDETVKVFFDETQVSFQTTGLEVVSRLIDGKFPDYRQLIPQQADTEVIIQKADFVRITKIASLFARESGGGVTLKADQVSSLLSIHSIASELGENTSEANAQVTHDGEITLNSRYVLEALGATGGSEVIFAFNGKVSPCVIREHATDPDCTHIIMPLKS